MEVTDRDGERVGRVRSRDVGETEEAGDRTGHRLLRPRTARADLVSALANLGFRPAQAEAAAEAALNKLGPAELEALLREALRTLRTAS